MRHEFCRGANTVVETGEQIPNTNPNEVMVIGTLENGGLFSMQVEGAQKHRTGIQIDISETEGVLRVTKPPRVPEQG